MKTTHRLIATRIALFTCITTSLAACGNSSPSESDAKTAVQARIGACDYLRVSDFTKINGTQVGDNLYQVEVKYSLILTPTSDMKQRAETLNADRVKLAEAKQAYAAASASSKADEDAWVQAHQHDPDTSIATHDPADPTKVTYTVELGESGARNQYLREHSGQLNGGATAEAYATQQERVRQDANVPNFANDLRKECPNIQLKALEQAFHRVNASTDLTQEVQNKWSETISIVKTDNGWQEAR
ncbi:hypothetical protein [Burkholderia seminalis]|uniref:hypothetical protein n=1 Tax=Burkholderia seminalis TaxID=488731 RepID=UPI0015888ADE|nr:hypothetical protein [Burkholderia seminalis]